MMTTADSYGRALFELGISREAILQSRELISACPELVKALSNPSIEKKEKHRVIDRIFPQEMRSFMKVFCDSGQMNQLQAADSAYEKCYLDSQGILQAEFYYAKEPDADQLAAVEQLIEKKYKKAGVKLILKHDPKLLGGFILRIGDKEYDRSIKGRLTAIYKKLAWR